MTSSNVSDFISVEVQRKLQHQFLVIRQQAIDELVNSIDTDQSNRECKIECFKAFVFELLSNDSWQAKQSAFIFARKLLKFTSSNSNENVFADKILELILHQKYLEFNEHRVRDAIAEYLGLMAKMNGMSVYLRCKSEIFHLIKTHFNREKNTQTDASSINTLNKLMNESKDNTNNNQALIVDTEGWKCLWSAIKTIERMISGLDSNFDENELDDNLQSVLKDCTSHMNRFVREVVYQTYTAICHSLQFKNKLFHEISIDLAIIIKEGLSDNWSQVRYASSKAVRELLLTIPAENESNSMTRESYFPILLPAMCLNRYYVAAGVRIYSLETWKMIMKMNGRQLVAKYIDDVCAFFTQQSIADNHAVREASCHCIAELALKIDKSAVAKHVPILLDSLMACFKDESWPVRNAACIALGDFVSQFPTEVSVKDLHELYVLWFEHLSDNIPSVREDSAMALGKVMQCLQLKQECMERCITHIKENIMRIKEQSSDSKKYSLYENTTLFGVAHKKQRDNDPQLHSGQQQFSCGSLAPKLKKATRSGCMDHGFSRGRQEWEFTDGCLHLLKELIVNGDVQYWETMYIQYIPVVSNFKHFAHFAQIQQTIWNNLPSIARKIGVRKYKLYLEMLVPAMVETLECDNRLAMNAAGICITFTNKFIGNRFFTPRLTAKQLEVVQGSQFVQLS